MLPLPLELQVSQCTETSPSGSRRQKREYFTLFLPSSGRELRIGLFHPNHTGEGGAKASKHATKSPTVLSVTFFFFVCLFLDFIFMYSLDLTWVSNLKP